MAVTSDAPMEQMIDHIPSPPPALPLPPSPSSHPSPPSSSPPSPRPPLPTPFRSHSLITPPPSPPFPPILPPSPPILDRLSIISLLGCHHLFDGRLSTR